MAAELARSVADRRSSQVQEKVELNANERAQSAEKTVSTREQLSDWKSRCDLSELARSQGWKLEAESSVAKKVLVRGDQKIEIRVGAKEDRYYDLNDVKKSGDALSFLQHTEGQTFGEAKAYLQAFVEAQGNKGPDRSKAVNMRPISKIKQRKYHRDFTREGQTPSSAQERYRGNSERGQQLHQRPASVRSTTTPGKERER
jgi:hypothetical protein